MTTISATATTEFVNTWLGFSDDQRDEAWRKLEDERKLIKKYGISREELITEDKEAHTEAATTWEKFDNRWRQKYEA